MLKLQLANNPAKSHWLVGDCLRIGAHADNDLRLTLPGVADFHLEVAIQGENLSLRTVGGSCQVNGRPGIDGQALAPGDSLRLGQAELWVVDPKRKVTPLENHATGVAKGWTLQVEHPQLQQRRFELKGTCILGRADDCEISVPYQMLSRHHAQLTPVEGGIELEDLGSSNGTSIRGERIHRVVLKAGASFQVAKLRFTIHAPADPAMNQTMVRPALSEAVIAAAMQSGKYPALDQPANTMNAEADARGRTTAVEPDSRGWLMPAVVIGLTAALCAVIWFML